MEEHVLAGSHQPGGVQQPGVCAGSVPEHAAQSWSWARISEMKNSSLSELEICKKTSVIPVLPLVATALA